MTAKDPIRDIQWSEVTVLGQTTVVATYRGWTVMRPKRDHDKQEMVRELLRAAVR